MDKDKMMEQLVDKFLDGATSNAEERLLYDYFAGRGANGPLARYAPMFGWYAGGMTAPLPRRRRPLAVRLAAGIGIAASVLLAAGAGIHYRNHLETQRLYAVYEGSYIVRGGKKITDLKAIMPELKRIESATRERTDKRRNISRMTPKEIFSMMERENNGNPNEPTI